MSYKYKIDYSSSSSTTTLDSDAWQNNTGGSNDYYAVDCYPKNPLVVKIEGDLEVGGKIKIGKQLPKGVELMKAYRVWMIYAEDRRKPIVKNDDFVIARDEEDAKVKSGLMKEVDDNWDADYLTFIVEEIGEVKVKEKAQEVKQV